MSRENLRKSASNTVLLVNPRATYVNEIAQKCYPPASLLYLAASLQNRGFGAVVVEANAFGLSDSEIARRITDARPLLVGFSVYTEILPQIRDLTRLARRAWPGARIVLGGPHATAVPRTTLDQFPEADFVLTGECEESLPQLCRALLDNGPLKEVPGLHFRENGRILRGPAHVFPDVHSLPWPDKNLVAAAYREKRYYTLLVRRRPVDTLFTSRGCPFSCGFCYNFRKQYRARTPEDVLEELAAICDRGIRDVEITDDTFTVNEERALSIFRLIQKERLPVSFRIKSRVDVFSERLAAEASKAGVYLVSFGMESASPEVLAAMNKKITPNLMARAVALCREHRLASHTSWVLGYPGETPETIENTVRFILKTKPTTANLAVLRPYPNTPVYLEARDRGTLVGEWSPDGGEVPWVRLPWANDRRTLETACRKAVARIYFTPHYISSFARQILAGANTTLLQYALQETSKLIRKKNPFSAA